ncbi:MAG: putative lipoprotein, partial [Candidatus Brocadiaceae bacterium]|nr:putative lipoprotein [Candidatus Brocadiaceae bacterium]
MPFKITQHTLMILIGLGMLSGCATSIKQLPVYTGDTDISHMSEHEEEAVNVQYLGVGGYLFRYGKSALITAPMFTNPSLFKLASLTRLK